MENTVEIHQNYTHHKLRTSPLAALLRRNGRVWMSLMLGLTDVAGIVFAGLVAVIVRTLLGQVLEPHRYLALAPVACLFPLVFYFRGLYPAHGLGPVEELRRLTINISLIFVIFTTFTFFSQAPAVYSRFTFVLAWLLALAAVPLGRKLTRAICVRLGVWGEPVIILGPQLEANDLRALLARSQNAGFLPVRVCDLKGCALNSVDEDSHPCAGCLESHARIAFVVHNEMDQLETLREKFRNSFERVVLITGKDQGQNLSRVEVRDFMYFKGLEVHQTLLDRTAQVQKRAIDLALSGLGLLALSPFLLLLALLIRLDSEGKIFYRQPRVGKDGQQFSLLKFRSMHVNADQILESVLEQDPALRREWEQYQKLSRDPRITRVGGWLRRFSLDELPQLWNIFTGEMSLVGPRPIMLNQRELYGGFQAFYKRVTPGLTGLWQISGRNQTTFTHRVELDVQYVKDWSLWLDLYILIRTVWVVLTREGAS